MRGVLVFAVVLSGAVAAADQADLVFGKEPYVVGPLEFTVLLPNGWRAAQDETGLVTQPADDPKGPGFIVSREPLLHEPKRFDDAWRAQLAAAGLDVKVGTTRAGKYRGWDAAWETDAGGGRSIEVHRIHVPDIEMLYNFSFTAPRGADLKPLVDGVLRSFRFTGGKAELEFNRTGTRLPLPGASIIVPKGYEMPEAARTYAWMKTLPGYTPPHEAGRIELNDVAVTSEKDGIEMVWSQAKTKLGDRAGRPRKRAAKYGDLKGQQLTAAFDGEDGVPKVFYAFVVRPRQYRSCIYVTLLVDEREDRLYKNLFKEVCEHLTLGG